MRRLPTAKRSVPDASDRFAQHSLQSDPPASGADRKTVGTPSVSPFASQRLQSDPPAWGTGCYNACLAFSSIYLLMVFTLTCCGVVNMESMPCCCNSFTISLFSKANLSAMVLM